jgi:hypothetical protein
MALQTLPRLKKPSGDNLVYGVNPALRVFFVLAGLGFGVLGWFYKWDEALPRLLFYCVGVMLVFSAFSEDRWTFRRRAAGDAGTPAEGGASSPDGAGTAFAPPIDDPVAANAAFEAEGGLRRHYGVLPVPRKWAVPRSRLYSVSLRSGKAGESVNGLDTDRDRIEASLHGMGRHAWVALVLNLSDGRSLVLAAGRPGQHDRLRKDGEAIAAWLGLDFEDASKPGA